jgi:excinuclease ABC subunit A
MQERIRIQGAREHNLRGVDVDLPRNGLVVVCGVSGSGKSSLALGTLAQEGRRRFLQTVGDWSEPRPAVDLVTGVPPTVTLEQSRRGPDANELVSGCLEVHDGLALLWAQGGIVHCAVCGRPLPVSDRETIARTLAGEPEGTRLTVMAPVLRGGDVAAVAPEIARQGFVRVRWNGQARRLDEETLDGTGDLDVIVDRISTGEGKASRIEEAIAVALAAGKGRALVDVGGDERAFADHPYCAIDDRSYENPTTAALSYRSPVGACATCQGAGVVDGAPCRTCAGTRLGELSRLLRLGGVSFHEALLAPLGAIALPALPPRLEPVGREIAGRLAQAASLGLGNLPLGRQLGVVSATEWTRARLAALLGAQLSGVLYVLDEPTDGLDAGTRDAVLRELRAAQERSNSIVVVGHDPALVRAADHVVELGPGAGREGGTVVFEGKAAALAKADTATGRSLREKKPPPHRVRKPRAHFDVKLTPVKNLRASSASIGLGIHTVVTGPAGSGKTAFASALTQSVRATGHERLLELPETRRGQSATSCVATAARVWNGVRNLLAETREAKVRGFGPEHFSLNRPGGRCEVCRGAGFVAIAYEGLARFEVPCEVCGGKRFERGALRATFLGVNAAEILAMTVSQARALFQNQRRIATPLGSLERVGLGYLQLGQPSKTLSGGEAQRLRLARELAAGGDLHGTMAILDAPSSGLHPADTKHLLDVLDGLVDAGLTLVSADTNPLVLARADAVLALADGAIG